MYCQYVTPISKTSLLTQEGGLLFVVSTVNLEKGKWYWVNLATTEVGTFRIHRVLGEPFERYN